MDTPGGNSRRSWSGPRHGSGPRGTAGGTRATVLGSLTIPGRPEQVATARAFVARTLSSHRVGADYDAATLLTSEIVTNAIQHTKSGVDGGTVTIVVIGSSILELGCGAGRVTHPLVALGHPVVAVDESPEMLAHVRGAETVRARIQDLALGRRFGVVLLASHLISTDDPAERAALLAACRDHVADDGCVIIQQQAPGWFASAADAEYVKDGIIFRVRNVSRPAPDLVSAVMEYVDGDRVWTHAFTARRLDHAQLTEVLAGSGLRLDRYLTDDHSWLRAVPA